MAMTMEHGTSQRCVCVCVRASDGKAMCRCALYAPQLSTAAADDDTTNVFRMVEFETETHVVARTNSALCSHKHTQIQVHFWSAHGFSLYTSIKWISSSSVVAVSRQVLPTVDWLRSLPAYRRIVEPGMMENKKRTNEWTNEGKRKLFDLVFAANVRLYHLIESTKSYNWCFRFGCLFRMLTRTTHTTHPIDSLCACQSICICLEPNILHQFL